LTSLSATTIPFEPKPCLGVNLFAAKPVDVTGYGGLYMTSAAFALIGDLKVDAVVPVVREEVDAGLATIAERGAARSVPAHATPARHLQRNPLDGQGDRGLAIGPGNILVREDEAPRELGRDTDPRVVEQQAAPRAAVCCHEFLDVQAVPAIEDHRRPQVAVKMTAHSAAAARP
jgi:hypothetical protein